MSKGKVSEASSSAKVHYYEMGTSLGANEYFTAHWDEIRDIVPKLDDDSLAISRAKKWFNNDDVLQQFYQIAQFSTLTEAITKLQNTKRSVKETVKIWDEAVASVTLTDFTSIKNKMNDVASKNIGLKMAKLIDLGDAKGLKKFKQFSEVNSQQLSSFKYAPLVSVDVERSFSTYKNILDDHRSNSKIEIFPFLKHIYPFPGYKLHKS